MPSFHGKIIKMSNRSSRAIVEMAKSRNCQKESKKVEFSQVFRLPAFCRDPTNTFAKLPINSGHLFMRPSPQIQMLDLAGFVIFPCLWNICILWNVECIMNWTVAHVYNSFKASLKCTHMCANFGLNAHSLCNSKTLLKLCVCMCVCVCVCVCV